MLHSGIAGSRRSSHFRFVSGQSLSSGSRFLSGRRSFGEIEVCLPCSASHHPGAMEVAEVNSPTEEEEEEEEEEEGEETASEPRPRTRSNPEGAEDRTLGAQTTVGSRSEGEGEAASVDDQSPSAPGTGPKTWQVPTPAPEIQIRTPRVNCPEKVIICLDLSEEMSVPKLESFNGSKTNALNVSQKMIEMFVRTKHKVNKGHEFALVVVNDDSAWLSGLTSDPRELCSCLYDLETASCSTFSILVTIVLRPLSG